MDAEQTAERIRASLAQIQAAREAGLQYARAWRARNKPKFDALYPQSLHHRRCRMCGQMVHVADGR